MIWVIVVVIAFVLWCIIGYFVGRNGDRIYLRYLGHTEDEIDEMQHGKDDSR